MMGFFGASKKESQAIIDRHEREAKAEKEAKKQAKKEREQYGRKGRGILCGWADDE
jgi:hypothetical protein